MKTDFNFLICVICVICGLESQLQSELNVPRWTRGRDRPERRRVTAVRVHVAKVGAIEGIENFRLKSQVEPFRQPKIATQREIPRLRAWSQKRTNAARPSA